MKKFLHAFSTTIIMLLLIGGMCVYMSAGDVFILLKPAVSFEELLMQNGEAGMHVKGDVCFAYDCFATEETWKESSNGTRTAAKTSHYYYAVPSYDSIFALEVKVDEQDVMDDLVDETWEYLYGGAEPSTTVSVEGMMVKMDAETEDLLVDYLEEVGFSKEEIKAMGDLLIVERCSVSGTFGVFGFGLVLVLLAVILYIVNVRKEAKLEKESTGADNNTNI